MTSSGLPTSAVDGPFWEGLGAGELRLQRCANCAVWTWPPQWRCRACGSWEMLWASVPKAGTVYAFARTRHPFTPETEGKTPFTTLLVELPGADGVRLLGLLAGPEDGVEIGAPVEGLIEPSSTLGDRQALRWKLSSPSAAEPVP